ncbi:DoxX family protein [Candidatus Woesearchaeota archaeon]|nr:DoxX family protein [Candidatus Woesearchaeota archaeon]
MHKIKNFLGKNKQYSVTIIRIGLAFVLLWFGLNQLVNPESFLGYIPQWLYPHDAMMQHEHAMQFMHNIPVPSVHVVLMGNGIFETAAGILLLIGLFTRVVAFIAALHLLVIAFSLGYNDIAVRDIGLSLMAASLVFSGGGHLSLDNKKKE